MSGIYKCEVIEVLGVTICAWVYLPDYGRFAYYLNEKRFGGMELYAGKVFYWDYDTGEVYEHRTGD